MLPPFSARNSNTYRPAASSAQSTMTLAHVAAHTDITRAHVTTQASELKTRTKPTPRRQPWVKRLLVRPVAPKLAGNLQLFADQCFSPHFKCGCGRCIDEREAYSCAHIAFSLEGALPVAVARAVRWVLLDSSTFPALMCVVTARLLIVGVHTRTQTRESESPPPENRACPLTHACARCSS